MDNMKNPIQIVLPPTALQSRFWQELPQIRSFWSIAPNRLARSPGLEPLFPSTVQQGNGKKNGRQFGLNVPQSLTIGF